MVVFQFKIQNGKICSKTNDKSNTRFTNSPYNVEILNAKENSFFNINGVRISISIYNQINNQYSTQ